MQPLGLGRGDILLHLGSLNLILDRLGLVFQVLDLLFEVLLARLRGEDLLRGRLGRGAGQPGVHGLDEFGVDLR